MSKNEEQAPEQVQLPQSPAEYSYIGDETVTMSAEVFKVFWRAIEDSIAKSIKREFHSRPQWVSVVTGEVLAATPTGDEVAKGLVKQVTSLEATFNEKDLSNFSESFEDWVYPNVINAKVALAEVHAQMIETGVSRPIEELQKIVEARQAAQAPQAPQAPQGPNTAMQVVEEEAAPEVANSPAPEPTAKTRTKRTRKATKK